MTTPLTDAIQSVLTAVKAIPYSWGTSVYGGIDKARPANLFQCVLLWNDQVSREHSGKGYSYAKPACFLEMVSETTTQLLDNVTDTDYKFRFHVVDMMLDAGDEETLDQNLAVIGYRDVLKTYMVGFTPTNCSTLFSIGDDQDFQHDDVYHYMVEMMALFTDTKGSIEDADQVKVIYKAPDTNLELTTTIGNI